MDTWVFQLLGIPVLSGVVVAFVNWWQKSRADHIARKVARLTAQVENLYGPLYYLLSNNEKMWAHVGRLDLQYKEQYCNQTFAKNEHAQKELLKDATNTITVMNEYTQRIIDNNREVMQLVKRQYAHTDPDDTEPLQDMIGTSGF